MMAFKNEAEAYSFFVKHVGLDHYLSCLSKHMQSITQQTTLVGFSVGASVVWRLSERDNHPQIKHAFCYYGSQIRHFTQIEPRFKITVILPASESHFDVVLLQKKIARKALVKTKQVDYLHGFMNHYSIHYNESGYKGQMAFLSLLNH